MASFTLFLGILCFFFASNVQSLSSTIPKTRKPIKKIAVIGSGIAGLGMAHALASLSNNEDDLELSLFDARSGLNTEAGAGIQINGGLTALGKINMDLQRAVMEAGLPVRKIESRTKAWKDPSSTSFDTLLQLNLEEVIRKGGDEVREGLVQGDDILWYGIMRGALQQVLVDNLPNGLSKQIQFDKTLSDIVPLDNQQGILCKFSDGSESGPFDMVIGCDGIRSAVKDYVETGAVKNGDIGIYSGIRIKYAVKDGDSTMDVKDTMLTQYFGDEGYGLTGVYGNGKDKPPSTCAISVALDDAYIGPFKRKEKKGAGEVDENVAWTQDARKELEEGRADMLKQVRSSDLPDFDLAPIISNADRFFELGVYFHNPFTLKGWSKEIADGSWLVLAGDSAHSMPPFLGQGANQALQDGYTLASKICEYNDIVQGRAIPPPITADGEQEEEKSLKVLLKEYEQRRWFPTASITIKSIFIGYLETGGVNGFYSKFRDVFFRVMGVVGVAKKVLLDAATPKL